MAAVYSATQTLLDLHANHLFPQSIDAASRLVLSSPGQFDYPIQSSFDPTFAQYEDSPNGSHSSWDGYHAGFPAGDQEMLEDSIPLPSINPAGTCLANEVNPFTFPLPTWEAPADVSRDSTSLASPTKCAPIADFSVNLLTAAGVRITIARSAMNRLSQHKARNYTVRRTLESTAQRYRSDSNYASLPPSKAASRGTKKKGSLLETLVGLEKKERSMPSYAFSKHGIRLQELVGSIGGPLNIESAPLSRTMVHLESTHGTMTESYIWSKDDFVPGLADINGFFSSVWTSWHSFAPTFPPVVGGVQSAWGFETKAQAPPFTLRNGSVLKSVLGRPAEGPYGVNLNDRLELVCQITTLITLCLAVVELQGQPTELRQQMDHIHDQIESLQLGNLASERVMWFVQSNDSSEIHSRRIWSAARYVWILKHVTYNVQCMVKDWLLKILTGQHPERCFKLDAFYFSYAS